MMFECKYCGKKFTKESTLSVHLCEPKRRYQQQDERFVQLAFRAYQYFYKSTMPQTQRDRTYDDFAKSKYYTAFTKFGRYLYDVHVDDPSKYIDYLLKNMVKIDRWHLDSVYEKADRVIVKAGSKDASLHGKDIPTIITELETKMRDAAANLEFEEAARLRDELKRIENKQLGLDVPGMPKSAQNINLKAEINAPIQLPSGRRPVRRN